MRKNTIVMATHGTLSAFDSSMTNWRSYADQLNYYFIANEITMDKKKVAILLSACGQATFKTICSLVDADTLKDIKCDRVCKNRSYLHIQLLTFNKPYLLL